LRWAEGNDAGRGRGERWVGPQRIYSKRRVYWGERKVGTGVLEGWIESVFSIGCSVYLVFLQC